jgi:hypothetical protein
MTTQLSQQHLFYECWHRDGGDCEDGLGMQTASAVLAEVGQCTTATSAYRPGSCDTALGADLNAARTEAERYRIDTRELNPTDVEGMRQLLVKGWPVAVAVAYHDGWQSDEATETGEVKLPGVSVERLGHAVCLFGFTENPVQPFPQGMFAFRNSWEGWGQETQLGRTSLANQGDGVMPMEYIGQFGRSAWAPADAF